MQRIAIIDYGMGNLHSASKALAHVSPESKIIVTADKAQIRAADKVVLPGVGAIRDCIGAMAELDLIELIKEQAQSKPFLGICVGMQALMSWSEENNGVDCLGVFPQKVEFFGEHLTDASGQKLKVPHMGWSQVHHNNHVLWKDIEQDSRFYFVHSYFVRSEAAAVEAGVTEYGQTVVAAVARENIFAVQFHPEKSQHAGLSLLRNFTQWAI